MSYTSPRAGKIEVAADMSKSEDIWAMRLLIERYHRAIGKAKSTIKILLVSDGARKSKGFALVSAVALCIQPISRSGMFSTNKVRAWVNIMRIVGILECDERTEVKR